MADNYIDYFEVEEYGTGFLTALDRLEEEATLLNVTALRDLVQGAVTRVNQELQSAGIQRSDLRGQRMSVDEAAERGRKEIERFHGYLTSLDDSATVDKEAFFKGMKVGLVSKFKPHDVKARLNDLVRGFEAAANATLPDRAARLAKLTTARTALDTALSDKGTSYAVKLQTTASLVEAREAFLVAYNQVAKPLLRGQLASLGREREMRDFFPDLRVNEGRRPVGSGEDAENDETPAQPETRPTN